MRLSAFRKLFVAVLTVLSGYLRSICVSVQVFSQWKEEKEKGDVFKQRGLANGHSLLHQHDSSNHFGWDAYEWFCFLVCA